MKVLYFHQHFITPDGSGGTRSYELARALVDRGHAVTMVCGQSDRGRLNLPWSDSRGAYEGLVDGIRVIAFPLNYSNSDGLLRRTLVFCRFALRSIGVALSEPHDLLFATSTPLTAAIPGIVRKLLKPKSRFVFEVRDLWPELPKALGVKNPILIWGMSALEWLAYRLADGCVGLAPGIVDGIRRRAPKGRRIVLVPNGCDLELFSPVKRASLDVPGVTEGDFVAGFMGAHGIANGLDCVLDVASILKRRQRMDIKIVLIGDGKKRPALVERAKREELHNCILRPLMKKTEIAKIAASFDCGLQVLADVPAFYFGTSPNKFFDYLASGLPVIVNYPGWLAELIAESNCGLVVPPSDPEAFANALEALADKPTLRAVMGVRARELGESSFDRLQLAAKFVGFLEEVHGQPK